MIRAGLDSPVGALTVIMVADGIVGLEWGEGPPPEGALATEAVTQLTAYFAKTRTTFRLPLRPRGSEFQRRFYAALCAIPYGETRTYGDLAKSLGVSAQAIGQACGANPIPILVPCHRVLGSAGLGGYSGAGGIDTKVALLRHEGAAGLLI